MTPQADLRDVPGDLRSDESAEAVILEVLDLNRPVDPDSEPLEVVPLEPVDLGSADDVVHLGVRGRPGADPAGVRRDNSVSRGHWSESNKSTLLNRTVRHWFNDYNLMALNRPDCPRWV